VHIAARNGDTAMLQCLDNNGADLSRKSYESDLGISNGVSNGVSNGALPPPESGDSAFMMAAWSGHEHAMAWLRNEGGVHTASADSLGQQATHIAARRGHVHILRWLSKHGGGLGAKDIAGRTPQMHANGAGQRAASEFIERELAVCRASLA
jgi:ankyrin repeat protein